MDKAEILAPAGSFESLVAAVRCGADAVYLGLSDLNARRNAVNFSNHDLKQAVEYCRARGVKVYITLNTVVSDSELQNALSIIECGCACGADAFIIQDLGILKLIKTAAPDMQVFASTQMSVQTVKGLLALTELGFSRAILPREISFDEAACLGDGSPIELEMFVHGALCMSVSGQCYLSSMIGGRSGNRGLCAQPCRLPFAVNNGTGFDLSLKDLSIIEDIPRLLKAGIKSFKIEGRMKRPQYVAAAVTACRQSLTGRIEQDLQDDLRSVFSRSGFTRGYIDSNLGRDMFGTRKKEDAAAGNAAISRISDLYRREMPRVPADFNLSARLGDRLSLSCTSGNVTVFEQSDFVVRQAVNKPSTRAGIETQLRKCGGTPFYPNNITIELDDDINIPMSVLNSLRRSVLKKIEDKLCECEPVKFTAYNPTIKNYSACMSGTVLRFANISQIPENIDHDAAIIVPLNTPCGDLKNLSKKVKSLGVELPRGIFGACGNVLQDLICAKECGANFAFCGTLDAVAIAKEAQIDIMGGFSLNVYNSLSIETVENFGLMSCVLSPELSLDNITKFGGNLKRGIIAYGRLPLMLTRN
ncbi:MAG: U32 family peptidase, partial [Oscillospiraceae bacterium]|nr:U32 family peptidase [Oscillospiraceae bacterium]